MKLTHAIQESLVALLLYDDSPGGAKTVRGLVRPKAYDPYFREIAEKADEFLERYEVPAGEHAQDIFEALIEAHPKDEEIYERIWDSIEATREGINREYILGRATEFSRHQRLKAGIAAAIDVIEKDREGAVDEAEAALSNTLKETYETFAPGLRLDDLDRSLAFLDAAEDALPTGIPQIDRYNLGPAPGRLHLFLAPSGRGKSWWLIHLAKQALLARKKVLFITMELFEEEVAGRFFQALYSISKRKEEVRRQRFDRDSLGRFVGVDEETLSDRPAITDSDIRGHLTGRVEKGERLLRNLLIKFFPSSSLSLRGLEAYLDSLEGSEGFIPDLIVIDYVDKMKTDPNNLRISIGALHDGMKGIAGKRRVAVATASQTNRSSYSAKLVTAEHAAEDISKINNADVAVTYSQTKEEKELGLARLFLAKGRTDVDGFTVLISQAYALGQFCLDSVAMVSSYWESFEEEDED